MQLLDKIQKGQKIRVEEIVKTDKGEIIEKDYECVATNENKKGVMFAVVIKPPEGCDLYFFTKNEDRKDIEYKETDKAKGYVIYQILKDTKDQYISIDITHYKLTGSTEDTITVRTQKITRI